jgi:hypothetical protein
MTSGLVRRSTVDEFFVAHQLRVLGWEGADRNGIAGVMLIGEPSVEHVDVTQAAAASGTTVVALRPSEGYCAAFGLGSSKAGGTLACLKVTTLPTATPGQLGGSESASSCGFRLRTLHPYSSFRSHAGHAVAVDDQGRAAWWWLPVGAGGVLFVGTNLSGDLVRYRQGDPAKANDRSSSEMWGYAGERPNYLFVEQRDGEAQYARHADEWIVFLSRSLAATTRRAEPAILPGGAPGAIVLTGDDDVAELGAYAAQLKLIGEHPITYFIHKETRHDSASLRELAARRNVDIGFHPDALDAPDRYAERFTAQARWLKELCGVDPRAVRNHGFLNDGYWGHLPVWLEHGVAISSNLPGFDGTVLNGSLLPGRLVYGEALTPHWSILTAIGDGVMFVNKWNDEQSARCIYDAADAIVSRGIPGVLVLNLHPANIARTEAMHLAALEVIRSGFVAWSMRECLAWFAGRDRVAKA